jgi:hypothetical protein
MSASDVSGARWTKSTRSQNGQSCVEWSLDHKPGQISVRDSKDPNGPALNFTPAEWEAFVAGVRDGEFDL